MADNKTKPMGKVILQVVIVAIVCAVVMVLVQNLLFGKANVPVTGAVAGTVSALTAMRLRTSTTAARDKE
jgi:hypothetical protein